MMDAVNWTAKRQRQLFAGFITKDSTKMPILGEGEADS